VGRGIGAASDYYRLRIIHVGDADVLDLQWRDDILWRHEASSPRAQESELYVVQAVAVTDSEEATPMGTFESPEDAHAALTSAQEDLESLTRSEFEARYFPVDGA
jgi:hypothetical protein